MISLGQLPNMATGQVETNLQQARYAIDMLQVIEEKTKGNLSPGEEQALSGLLHQLRMTFVSVQSGRATPRQSLNRWILASNRTSPRPAGCNVAFVAQ